MLNKVTVEGVVTAKIWRYDDDLFFRLACYRDATRPLKPLHPNAVDKTDKKAAPDYITIRVPGGMIAGVPVAVKREQHLRVYGWLASSDERLTLGDFLRQAEGPKPELREHLDLAMPTYRLDVVCERIVLLED